jgi:hypothetical protein
MRLARRHRAPVLLPVEFPIHVHVKILVLVHVLPADVRPPGGGGESELGLQAARMERRLILEAAAHLAAGGGDFSHRQRLRRPRRTRLLF